MGDHNLTEQQKFNKWVRSQIDELHHIVSQMAILFDKKLAENKSKDSIPKGLRKHDIEA